MKNEDFSCKELGLKQKNARRISKKQRAMQATMGPLFGEWH